MERFGTVASIKFCDSNPFSNFFSGVRICPEVSH